jgi:hypothetical protein
MLRLLKPNPSMTLFGARILFAFFASSLVLAHESHHEPAPPTVATTADEESFLKENDAAMTKMMDDMSIKPTGDVDRDFVAMMVPHHQGAIDMAQAELRYGRPTGKSRPRHLGRVRRRSGRYVPLGRKGC